MKIIYMLSFVMYFVKFINFRFKFKKNLHVHHFNPWPARIFSSLPSASFGLLIAPFMQQVDDLFLVIPLNDYFSILGTSAYSALCL